MGTSPLKFMAAALEALPHAVLVVDLKGKILAFNAAARAVLTIGECLPGTGREDTPAPVDWRSQLAALADGADTITARNVHWPGKGNRRMLVDVYLRRLETANDRAAVVLVEDVSERASMERRLVAQERMGALGRLAGRVAHELNNPLDGILRYVGLAQRAEGDKAGEYLANARSGLERMAGIIRDMLGQTATGAPGVDRAPVELLLDEAIMVMQPPALARGVALACDVAEEACTPVPQCLFQVFCNVIKNALDAMPDGGLLGVRMSRRDDNCVIEFADTGCGLAGEDTERIFEPFYTTKPGRGAGLGLAVCRSMLSRARGTITAAARTDKGAIFTVTIPMTAGP